MPKYYKVTLTQSLTRQKVIKVGAETEEEALGIAWSLRADHGKWTELISDGEPWAEELTDIHATD